MDRRERTEGFEDPGLPEEMLLEHTIPHGGALPPHLLTNRPFLWLVLGEGVAALAFWAFLAAMFAEAAFQFHATPAQMSLMLASFSLPFVLFTPIQGVLVDRGSPKWLNVFGYVIFVGAVPVAATAGSLPLLYLASLLVGLADATIQPARSALTGLLVEEHSLVQANGMLSAAIQLALVLGPLVGGVLIRTSGVRAVYLVALAVSVLSLPFFVLVPDRRHGGERPAIRLRDLGDGVRTSWRKPELRVLLFLAGAMFLMLNVFFALEPLFIKDTLHRGKDALPFLWSTHGAGALIGAIFVTRTKRGTGLELAFVGAGLVAAALGMLLYVGVATYPVALAATALMGGGFSFYFAPSLALIQRVAGGEQRGRVTSVFGVLQEGMGLVSSLSIVALGGIVVVRPTLAGTALLLGLTGLLGLRAFARLAPRVPAVAPADDG